MRNRSVTQQFGREAAWQVRLSSLSLFKAACNATRHQSPARAPHFVVRAYVLQRDAVTLKGVAHELKEITSPSVNIVHIRRQNLCDNSDLSAIVQELPSFSSKVSWMTHCLRLALQIFHSMKAASVKLNCSLVVSDTVFTGQMFSCKCCRGF